MIVELDKNLCKGMDQNKAAKGQMVELTISLGRCSQLRGPKPCTCNDLPIIGLQKKTFIHALLYLDKVKDAPMIEDHVR